MLSTESHALISPENSRIDYSYKEYQINNIDVILQPVTHRREFHRISRRQGFSPLNLVSKSYAEIYYNGPEQRACSQQFVAGESTHVNPRHAQDR